MMITADKADLERELRHVGQIAARKIPAPAEVARHVLLSTSGNGDALQLAATDLEVSLQTRCAARVSAQGTATAPAAKLNEVVKSLPDGEIEIELRKAGWLEVRSGDAVFELASFPAADFPVMPTVDFEDAIEFPADVLGEMIRRTLFAVTDQDVRYAMNGALLEIDGDKVRMVATDAHRLAMVERDGIELEAQTQVKTIIPKKALAKIRDLSEPEATVLFTQDDRQLHFRVGYRVLSGRLIEGNFPAYEKVIPKADEAACVRFDRTSMRDAIGRATLLSPRKGLCVRFVFENGSAVVSAADGQLGKATETVPVEYAGERIQVVFNGRYLVDFLDATKADRIALYVKDDTSPGLLLPEPQDGSRYCYTAMPMRP